MLKKSSIAPVVKRVVNNLAEKKFFRITASPVSAVANWTFVHELYNIVNGTAATNRIGNRIKVQYIDWLITIVPSATVDAAGGSSCRVIFWHDRDCRGTSPVGDQVFTTNTYNDVRNPLYKSRYSIQAQRVHNMTVISNNAGATYATGPTAHIAYRQKINKTLEYLTSTPAITDLYKDNYGMAFSADSSTGCCALTWKATVYFTDA